MRYKMLFWQVMLIAVWLVVILPVKSTLAGSATWNEDADGLWGNPANWTPMTVPNGPSDVATFATSNANAVALPSLGIASIVFVPGASAFSFTERSGTFTMSGAGVVNDSGVAQNFIAQPPPNETFGDDPVISFTGEASAGDAIYSNYGQGFEKIPTGSTTFRNNATAANATIFNHTGQFGTGGETSFYDASTAGFGTFFNDGADSDGLANGFTQFFGTSSADHASFTCHGAAVVFPLSIGGSVSFNDDSTAAESTFVVEGGTVAQAPGGKVSFMENATAASSTLTIKAGSNGGLDGSLSFQGLSLGGEARIILSGTLDLSFHGGSGLTIGSIEGSGTVMLVGTHLAVGSNHLPTTFSGTIEDGNIAGGSLGIIGGRLALTNDNTYTGGTTIDGGTLLVNNATGSATGPGAVTVSNGTLAGIGIISGAVTVGTAPGLRPGVSPGAEARRAIGTLTSLSSVTFGSDAVYRCEVRKKRADKLSANGVMIDSTAKFHLVPLQPLVLRLGTALTVIDNTSPVLPISGSFANLEQGSILNVGGTKLQADYTGGDGNDLTLTVVP